MTEDKLRELATVIVAQYAAQNRPYDWAGTALRGHRTTTDRPMETVGWYSGFYKAALFGSARKQFEYRGMFSTALSAWEEVPAECEWIVFVDVPALKMYYTEAATWRAIAQVYDTRNHGERIGGDINDCVFRVAP